MSKGAIYELLAKLEWTTSDFDQSEFSKEMLQSIKNQRHYREELFRIFRSFDISHSVVPQGFFWTLSRLRENATKKKIPNLMIENTFLNDRILVEPTDPDYFIGKSLSSRAHNFSLLKKFNRRDINQR